MKKLHAEATFNLTMRGTVFVLHEALPPVRVGERILVDGKEYTVKEIIMPTRPGNDQVSIVVEE